MSNENQKSEAVQPAGEMPERPKGLRTSWTQCESYISGLEAENAALRARLGEGEKAS